MGAAVATAPEVRRLAPQPGFQTNVLSINADIIICGSGAGVGKTFAELLAMTRYLNVKNYGAVIFRRELPMIKNEGGLWDESSKLFSGFAAPNLSELSWAFPPHDDKIRFAGMQLLTDRFNWDGSQIPGIGFDQLEQFEEEQFWYMLSRNRTTCGVIPFVFGTCNPIPADHPIGGWLNRLVSWYIGEDGYFIPERSGIVRWLARVKDVVYWGDTREGLVESLKTIHPDIDPVDFQPKSFAFVGGTLDENQILLKMNPEYRASLLAMPAHERERLLGDGKRGGNWKVKPTAGKVFNRTWFKSILRAYPSDVVKWIRYWDKAGTEGGGKYSAGVLVGKRANGRTLIANVVRGQWSANGRETVMQQTAAADRAAGYDPDIWVEQEPGSGGKESAEATVINLAGYTIHTERVTGDKVTRSGPLSSQVEAGNVDLMENLGQTVNGVSALEAFLTEFQNFDGVRGFSDQVDAASGGFNKLNVPEKVTAGVW
jgi:predicted phage terminase large subunit-like protein